METIVIADTSCLIILDKIGHLHLLKDLYNHIIITTQVANEFAASLPDWIVVQSPVNSDLQKLLEETLDPGESSAIALAMEIKDCYLVLDDLRARKVAASMNLLFTGTLGIIASAKQRGIIIAARPLFEQVRATNFRISEKFMLEILSELGE